MASLASWLARITSMFAKHCAVTLRGNCSCHCTLFHQNGIILFRVSTPIRELTTIAAMCSHGTASRLTNPQVHCPKYNPFISSIGMITVCFATALTSRLLMLHSHSLPRSTMLIVKSWQLTPSNTLEYSLPHVD
jgi:hypothetical protein